MCRMCKPTDIKTFVTAGDAIFTVSFTGKSGENHRYTYRVSVAEDRNGNSTGRFFVKLLAGPDNLSDYQYIGLLDTSNGLDHIAFRTTAKSKLPASSLPCRLIDRFAVAVLGHGESPNELPGGVEFRHAGRCGRCGRALTVPESIDRGIGPDCAEAMGIG